MFRGTLIAQVIGFVGAIFLAKLYGEEAYGYLGFFVSLISIVSIISTLQLEKCIVIAKNEEESNNWFQFLLLLTPIITILIFACILFPTITILNVEKGNIIILLVFFASIFFTLNLIHENFFTFKKEFSIISNSRILLTISNFVLQLTLFYYYNFLGLIIGFLSSQVILLLFFIFKKNKCYIKINLEKIKKGVAKNSTIIKYLLPSNFINSLANNLMPILILAVFGAKEAGVYFFSTKILSAPLFLISSSVSQVFFQKSSELYKKDKTELLKISKKITYTNLLLMTVFLIVINTIGISILEHYFNKNWVNLRLYTLILSVLIFARTSFNPISSLIVVLNKNLESLLFNSYLLIINLLAIYLGYNYNNITLTILFMAIFGGLGYFILVTYFFNHLKHIAKNDV